MAMTTQITEVLMSRLCHELVGPVGAVANGIEFMIEMEEDEGDTGDAVQLVSDSATRAASRLQFYRLAYGNAGRVTESFVAFHEAATDFLKETRVTLDWSEPLNGGLLTKPAGGKIALIAIEILARGLSRGGTLTIEIGRDETVFQAVGERMNLQGEARDVLVSPDAGTEINAHTVHCKYLMVLIEDAGLNLTLNEKDDQLDLVLR